MKGLIYSLTAAVMAFVATTSFAGFVASVNG